MPLRWYSILFLLLPLSALSQKGKLETHYYHLDLKQSEGEVDKDGNKTGLWKFWSAEGDLVKTATYKNGVLHGEKQVEVLHPNTGLAMVFNEKLYEIALRRQKISALDTIIERMYYKDGMLDGIKSVFDDNGKLISEIEFKEDEKHGQERIYNPKGGRITERHFYFKGESDSAYFYNKLGEIEQKTILQKNGHEINRYYIQEKLYQQIESYEVDGGIERISCYWRSGILEKCDTLMEYYTVADEDAYVVPDDSVTASPEEEIFFITEVMPEFPGGFAEMYKFIQSNIKIDTSKVQHPVDKNIFAGFVVRKDGSITDIKILRGIEPELDNAVIELISKMPAWIPGKQNGRVVNVEYKIPVKIKIDE